MEFNDRRKMTGFEKAQRGYSTGAVNTGTGKSGYQVSGSVTVKGGNTIPTGAVQARYENYEKPITTSNKGNKSALKAINKGMK
jgi:hypothetical protein